MAGCTTASLRQGRHLACCAEPVSWPWTVARVEASRSAKIARIILLRPLEDDMLWCTACIAGIKEGERLRVTVPQTKASFARGLCSYYCVFLQCPLRAIGYIGASVRAIDRLLIFALRSSTFGAQ